MLCFISFPEVSRNDICCPGMCIQRHILELSSFSSISRPK
jgi:hypothetical protein